MMKTSLWFPVVVLPSVLLLIPLAASRWVEGWAWGVASYVLAWVMMAGVGALYVMVTRSSRHLAYRLATALALGTAFLIVWGNLAVGFIGSEDNPANLLYGVVLAVGAVGAALGRFTPLGMARALTATAVVQLLVPVIAWALWPADFSPGVGQVMALNAALAVLFAGAAGLYAWAARSVRPGMEAHGRAG